MFRKTLFYVLDTLLLPASRLLLPASCLLLLASCLLPLASCTPRSPTPTPLTTPSVIPLPSPTLTTTPAPLTADIDPAPGRIKERRPDFCVHFDQPMDMEQTEAALSLTPPLPFTTRWQDAQTLCITPAQPLSPGEHYRLSIERTAASAYGVPLTQAASWNYWTADLVSSVAWKRGAGKPALAIYFNYQMDPQSVKDSIEIRPSLGEATYHWNDTHTTLVLTPTLPPPGEIEVTVRFREGLKDEAGDPLSPPEPLFLTTPSPILAVDPAPGSEIHPATSIQITFDRLMDQAQTEDSFHISPQVAGRFEWQETTLIFYPQDTGLEPYTTYTVTIDTTAAGRGGHPVLAKEYSWSFYTEGYTSILDFGWGPNAQVLNADGRRAVQFTGYTSEQHIVTFSLYRLDLTQFLDRYSSGFKGVAGWENRPISVEGLTLVRQWEQDLWETEFYPKETQIPADVPPGLYILNMEAEWLQDQLILVLTRHLLMLKQSEGEIVSWVTDFDGRGVANVEVGVYARDGELIAQGTTDRDGIFRTVVSRDPQPLIVVARSGDDFTVAGLSNEWRSRANRWWGWWSPTPTLPDYAVYKYTVRPL